jgi:Anp1
MKPLVCAFVLKQSSNLAHHLSKHGGIAAGVASLSRVPSMLNPSLLTIIASLSGLFVKVPLDRSAWLKSPEPVATAPVPPPDLDSIDRLPPIDLPYILILTPIKDGEKFLPQYLNNLRALQYPLDRISLGFLESDSQDRTYQTIEANRPQLRAQFRRVELYQLSHKLNLSQQQAGLNEKEDLISPRQRIRLLAEVNDPSKLAMQTILSEHFSLATASLLEN